MDIFLYFVAALLVVGGAIGTVLPGLPGVPLAFGGLLLAAWVDNFELVSVTTIIVLGVLTAITIVIDFVASVLGAKKVGASKYAITGAAIGTLIGLAAGFIGVFIGPFIGAALGELYAGSTLSKASEVGIATWVGMLIGTVLKLGILFVMIVTFIVALF